MSCMCRLESSKGTYAEEWSNWEKQLRETLLSNADYLNSIQVIILSLVPSHPLPIPLLNSVKHVFPMMSLLQVPFDFAVNQVSEQLKKVVRGDYTAPSTEKRKLGTIVFAAVSLPVTRIQILLNDVS